MGSATFALTLVEHDFSDGYHSDQFCRVRTSPTPRMVKGVRHVHFYAARRFDPTSNFLWDDFRI